MFRQTVKLLHNTAKLTRIPSNVSGNNSLSRFLHSTNPLTAQTSQENNLREFKGVWSDMVQDLMAHAKQYDTIVMPKYLEKCLQYNVKGKNITAHALILTYKFTAKVEDITMENLRLVYCLAWCLEILKTYFALVDDILDKNETRCGYKCWYKLDGVGSVGASNDCMIMEMSAYHLLKKYFGDKEYYSKLVDLFHDLSFSVSVNQFQERAATEAGIASFTMEQYKSLAGNKTGHIFYFPVALAMHMAGCENLEIFQEVKNFMFEQGVLHQIQNDYLDFFGDPAVTGKIGTDIQQGKCTWFAVEAMRKASDEQKKVLEECYGQIDPEKVIRVKKVYEDLQLPQAFKILEENTHNNFSSQIQQMADLKYRQLCLAIIDRTKLSASEDKLT